MFGVTAEHALRALTTMATMPEDTVILGRDLAESANIPANYLSQILWALCNAELIDATRGSEGGYRLHMKPEEIRLVEVVELFDHAHAKFACLLGDGKECSDQDPCSAPAAWREVRNVWAPMTGDGTVEKWRHDQKKLVRYDNLSAIVEPGRRGPRDAQIDSGDGEHTRSGVVWPLRRAARRWEMSSRRWPRVQRARASSFGRDCDSFQKQRQPRADLPGD